MRKRTSVAAGVLALAAALMAIGVSTSGAAANHRVGSPNVRPIVGRVQPLKNTTGKKIKIAMISFPSSNEFFSTIYHASGVANDVLKGYNASVTYLTVNSFTEQAENSAAQVALLQGYNAIGFVPLDAGVCPVIKKAVAQGIKTATFITSAPCAQSSGALFFHGEDLYKDWKNVAVPALVRAVRADPYWKGKDCKVGVITGAFNVPTHELMRHGILAGLKGLAGITPVSSGVQVNNDLSQVGPAVRTYIQRDPTDLCGIIVDIGDAGAAAQALTSAQAKHIKVVSADFTKGGVAALRQGKQAALIGQDPFGEAYDTAMLLYNAVVSGKNPPYYEPVTDSVMTRSNIGPLLAAQTSGKAPTK